jgi:hypothetical protein
VEVGPGNQDVGHRRWFLYPKLEQFGYGTVPYQPTSSTSPNGTDAWLVPSDVYSKQPTRDLVAPEYVAWPRAGYVPVLMMPRYERRWSLSCAGCSFAGATAEVSENGKALTVAHEAPVSGYGDPTFVFRPQGAFDLVQGDQVVRLQGELTYNVTVKNVTMANGAKKNFSYQVIAYDQQAAEETMLLPKYNITDMWWAGQQENGWGLSLSQGVGGAVFGTWYYYLAGGTPTWATVIGNWETATRFAGSVYTATGSPYTQATYDPSQFKASPPIGTMSVDFASAGAATMNYTVNGQAGSKSIARINFGAVKYTDGSNYTSIWWAGEKENGWGMSINQQYRTTFAVAYIYDAAGKPTWFTLSGENAGDGAVISGKIYTASGSPLFGAPYDASRFNVKEVGTAELKFSGDNNGTLTYTLNGTKVVKQITRLVF